MKRRPKEENILLGLIITALLIGALVGALITGVIDARAADDVPMDTFPAASKEAKEEREIVSTIEKEAPVETTAPKEPEVTSAPAQEEKVADEKKTTDHPVGVCEITAYCTCVKCCGIWSEDHPSRQGTGYVQKTATGTIPTEGRTVAVDKDVIPLGSIVIIDGVTYIAEDTGNAVEGNVVDIYFDSHEEAVQFGRRTAQVTYVK